MKKSPTLPAWPRALSAALAASYVSLSESRFRQLAAAGDAPAPIHLPGKRIAWLREDLDAWLDRLAGRAATSPARNPWDEADGIGHAALP